MLSLGSRDGRKGLGFGVVEEMEETELEEGEACYYQDDDGTNTDPDVELSSLSYIDEKIQDVLGHFQKDFEGGVSAENLGAKFGGYGSFLPTCQRSPSIWSHPRTEQKVQTHTAPKSPNNLPLEGARQNPAIPSSASHSIRHLPTSANTQPGMMGPFTAKRDTRNSVAEGAEEFTPKHDSANKPVSGTDQKKLKVLFKMGSDNVSARKNAAIYSGLGLDISPSSSLEDSPDGSGELSPEFRDLTDESPMTILKTMTSFPVLGESLLSPLLESLLYLTEKEKPLIKDSKSGTTRKSSQETTSMLPDEIPSVKELKGFCEKKIKSVGKNGRPMEVKNANGKDAENDMTDFLKNQIDIETLAGRDLVTHVLKLPLLSCSKDTNEKPEKPIKGDMARGPSRAPDLSKDAYKGVAKDRPFSSDAVKEVILAPVVGQDTGRVSNEGNEFASLKGKLSSKMTSSDKACEEKKASSQKDGNGRGDKTMDAGNSDYDGFKEQKDHSSGFAEPIKQKVAKKAASCEQDGVKMSQEKGGKKKSKGHQSKGRPDVELPKECLRDISSVKPKHKKKSSHTRDSSTKSKSDAVKSHKELNKTIGRECARDSLGNITIEPAENRIDPPEMHFKYKLKDPKVEFEKETGSFAEKSKEKSGGKNVEKPSTLEAYPKAPSATPLTANGPTSNAVPLPVAPFVINENWVCCDRCQKWRLLPFGTDPVSLPKKWLCSMLNWLPGMNKCTISEEETTKALNALYQVPITENQNNPHSRYDGASGMTVADVRHPDQSHEFGSQAMPGGGKKKHGSKDASSALSHSTLTHVPNAIKKTEQASVRSRSLDDVNHYPLESNSGNKAAFQHVNKSNTFAIEKHQHKHKEKHKLSERYSDGGDCIEPSGKHSKNKSKGEVDQDGFRISKKSKTETNEDWHSDHDIAGKAISNLSNGLPKVTCKNPQRHGDYSSSKDSKDDMKETSLAAGKKPKAQVQGSLDGEYKTQSGVADMGKSDKADFAAKKRKLKEWQQSQAHPGTLLGSVSDNMVSVKEETRESELRKEKKARASKSEGKESSTSKTDGRLDKKSRVTKIVLTGSRESLADGMEEERKGGNVHQRANAAPQRAFDGMDSLKRDLGYAQPSTAATSSSSKVSGKSKANFHEVKGSPVESVSSSPLRISNTDRLTNTRRNPLGNDDTTNVGFSVIGSPRRCSDGECDGGSDRSGTIRKEKAASVVQLSSQESQRAVESSMIHAYQGRDANHLSSDKLEDCMLTKVFDGAHSNLSPSEIENINVVNGSADNSDQHNPYLRAMHCKDHDPDPDPDPEKPNNHYHSNGSCQRKSGKGSSSRSKDRHRNSRSDFEKGKVKVSDSFSEQGELYPTKSSGSCRYDPDIDHSPHHEDLWDRKYNLQEKRSVNSSKDEKSCSGKKDSMAKWPSNARRDSQPKFGIHENSDVGSPMLSKQHTDFNSRSGKPVAICSKDGKSNQQQNLPEATVREDERFSNKNNRAEMASGRGRSQLYPPSRDKQERQSQCPPAMPPLIKGSRSDVLPVDASSGDALKVPKQPRKPENQNGGLNSGRHQMPNGIAGRDLDAPSPARKDCRQSTGDAALREAKDLKHSADRLKNGGAGLESTGLYFQAALKFLHGALLLEHCNAESAKHGEMTPSMQVYSDTATLCRFCAQEYERCKEMAAAALAYKCMEVAYMRVIYFRQFIASKDRHELHAALQAIPPGFTCPLQFTLWLLLLRI
ncbi:cysteine-tryptophan domain-containing zinc finger protein 7 isoform X2 [Magnolia sinica]|uniref:cysteine-tryptophan domain-containing zinc finger protein 7 isoform X2 n=1 Tax=Magnolia sinica TaxID=86752 RepID=UPI002658622C|nr:cysteine-tryptophan domain-containing zinc finger protein 7 isoform X2 [Magnolia sinica]